MKDLSQGLQQAEQQLAMARQHQTRLAQSNSDTHGKAQRLQLFALGLGALTFLCLIVALIVLFSQNTAIGSGLFILSIACAAGTALNIYSHKRLREGQKMVDSQMQEALNRVGMMTAAREAALRRGGSREELSRVEQEIRSLGGSVPRSLEEGQRLLEQIPNVVENPAALQQQLKQRRDEVNAEQQRVKAALDGAADLRHEHAQLDELRKREDWDNIEEHLRQDQAVIERLQQEITLLAGQEGLPLASVNARLQVVTFDTFSSGQMPPFEDEEGIPELETLVDNTISSIEHEIATIDVKHDLAGDLASQVKVHQEALDILLVRKHVLEERNASYQADNPLQQIERAREQQAALREALQSLRDSLRQRVKALGADFSHTAITNAEIQSRKQLENLHITLGNKMVLQEKLSDYTTRLKERQESLSELYKQLSKFSNTLGNWIVPLNPFADALQALRARCERELQEINEATLQQEKKNLQDQDGALKAKVALCKQEIETAHEHIAALLARNSRPAVKDYTLQELIAVWPLLDKHSVQDRSRLSEEQAQLEKELSELEQQELDLSKQLGIEEEEPLNLEEEQRQMEQQERSYQTKKYGLRLVEAVNQRLVEKVMPRAEQYMHQILPSLTGGRYHDVHLVMETEENPDGACQLQVWESAAGEYVPKSELSGGASDQLSLALRLAFTVASLP
ncbi:MAG: hypothetical protein J2P36_32605, partial [Ktedonobacteraceae bacterium]|nr:hypothetical protein [Ktedonobacteraceae bacterium]